METKKLDILCLKLCTELMKAHKSQWENLNTPDYTVQKGRKYWKIVSTATGDSSYQGSTVWGFIIVANEKFIFGDVLKAAGWRTPALNKPRGNLFDGYDVTANRMRIYGPDYLI